MTIIHKLNTVWEDEGCYQAECSCGWLGDWHSQNEDAEAEWHHHCDKLNPVVLG